MHPQSKSSETEKHRARLQIPEFRTMLEESTMLLQHPRLRDLLALHAAKCMHSQKAIQQRSARRPNMPKDDRQERVLPALKVRMERRRKAEIKH